MLHIRRYFAPLTVTMTPTTPTAMDVQLADPASTETVLLMDIPCRESMTTGGLYQLINLIESQAKARNPELFNRHVVNKLYPQ